MSITVKYITVKYILILGAVLTGIAGIITLADMAHERGVIAQQSPCVRALAATETEREVLLVVVAQPLCADLVDDSLLAPRRAAPEETP